LFTNQNWYQTVFNVKDLIRELKLLSQDMPVKFHENQNNQSDSAETETKTETKTETNVSTSVGVDIILLNRDTEDVYLTFEEGGKWEWLING
jgi:hypothetical protein